MYDAATISKAWETDPGVDIFIYAVMGITYVCTAFPSTFGTIPIVTVRSAILWYLLAEGILKLINLENHPEDEASIWTMQNWLIYCLRRYFLEVLINFLYAFTQTVVGLNWVLNIIPLGLTYANIFIF